MVIPFVVFAAITLPQEPASPAPVPAVPAAGEAELLPIVDVPLPDGVVLEVGGMAWLDGALYVTTRRGEIHRITGADTGAPEVTLWAEGLQEPLGLVAHDGWLVCAQRGELSKLRDRDGDGRMDELVTLAGGWPLSGNYHEYAFGPALAGDSSFWVTLNKPFGDEPFGRADWRGFAVRVPVGGGAFEPVAAGLRSPAGVGTAPDGAVWFTDNQGEWCATSKFAPLAVGDFHGHPWGIDSCRLPASQAPHPGEVKSGLRMAEAARTIPGFRLPAVWIPYDLCGRSPAGFVWDEVGRVPALRGQVFCGDQYSAEVFRMSLEQVGGGFQGACYPFRRGLKCGITRVLWEAPGSEKRRLWCGLTNRGWGSLGQSEHGLSYVEFDPERLAAWFDVVEVKAAAGGFVVSFPRALDAVTALPASFAVRSWTYDHHEAYGCPPRDVRSHVVTAARLGDDLAVTIDVAGLEPCRVYEVRCAGVRAHDGAAPLHGVAWYTRNAP
jgi:hypothetical protein